MRIVKKKLSQAIKKTQIVQHQHHRQRTATFRTLDRGRHSSDIS